MPRKNHKCAPSTICKQKLPDVSHGAHDTDAPTSHNETFRSKGYNVTSSQAYPAIPVAHVGQQLGSVKQWQTVPSSLPTTNNLKRLQPKLSGVHCKNTSGAAGLPINRREFKWFLKAGNLIPVRAQVANRDLVEVLPRIEFVLQPFPQALDMHMSQCALADTRPYELAYTIPSGITHQGTLVTNMVTVG